MSRDLTKAAEMAAKLRQLAAQHRELFGGDAEALKEATDLDLLADGITVAGEPTREQMLAFLDAAIRLTKKTDAMRLSRQQREGSK